MSSTYKNEHNDGYVVQIKAFFLTTFSLLKVSRMQRNSEILFVFLVLNVFYSTCTAEQDKDDYIDRDKGFLFDNFPGHTLELPIDMKGVDQNTTLVSSRMDCVFACVGVPWCRSVNFKNTSQKNSLHKCELLSFDKHTHKKYLKQNESSTHLSIKDPCEDSPCLNDGKCIRRNNRQDYLCQCKGYTGEKCQHAITVTVSQNCSSPTYQSTIPHSGEIMSPNYPGTYSHHLNCYWRISSNTKIGLYFKTFSTEGTNDVVTIHDGSSSSSTVLGKYSGNIKPVLYFTSSTNNLYMTFKTDLSVVRTGFAVKFHALVQGSLRLNGTSISRLGRVEVFYNNQWGTICDDGWDLNDATVVCKQLGFPGAKTAYSGAKHGQGSGKIWVDDLACTGSESNIQDCPSRTWGTHDCSQGEDASVECHKRVRLVNGGSANKGRVEVYHQGQWGTVCDDDWDIQDAKVVCREVGYSSASSAPGSAQYGQGTGPIWIDDLKCLGNEDSLLSCGYRGWISANSGCSHSEDAGVVCN